MKITKKAQKISKNLQKSSKIAKTKGILFLYQKINKKDTKKSPKTEKFTKKLGKNHQK